MPHDKSRHNVVLTIAGLDPSGGAGIIADIKTFVAFGCAPAAAITSLTFQNSGGVFGALHQTANSVRGQVLPIIEELHVASMKTGMLPTRAIVSEVARLIREMNLPSPVVDPVLRSSSGYELVDEDTIEVLLSELMSLARVITPNVPEAERLTGLSIKGESEMREAARELREMGARAVLVKGGHLSGARASCPQASEPEKAGRMPALPVEAIDVLDDEGRVSLFRGEWIDAPPMRGTGCVLSAAIAACLGRGIDLEEAVGTAKNFVSNAIRKSR